MRAPSHLRWAIRLWSRHPVTAGVVFLILALGIGAATSVFSVVSGVLLRPLPFDDADELVLVRERNVEGGSTSRTSGATYLDWKAADETLRGLTLYTEGSVDYAGGPEPVRLASTSVESSFFQVLGVGMVVGRPLLASDDVEGAPPVAVISHDLWRGAFASDPGVVGRTVRFGDRAVEVVGVAPPGFDYPDGTRVWTPLFGGGLPEWASIRGARFLAAVGRLAEGVTPRAAESRLSGIMAGIPELEGWEARVVPLRDALLGNVRTPLWILLAAVLLFLLVACANVSSLLLARTHGRRRELAIRRALGAGNGGIAGQLLAESLVLVAAAGAAGVALSVFGTDLLVALSPRELPETARIAVDGRVLGFAVLVTFVTAGVTTLAPLLRARGLTLSPELSAAGGRTTAGGREEDRLWSGIVVAEVALTVLLLVGAGLLGRSFAALTSVETGLRPERVTTFHLSPPDYRYESEAEVAAFQDALLERIRRLPGVDEAALARNLPVTGRTMTAPVVLEGPEGDREDLPQTEFTSVTPGYFRALGIRLLEGRSFRPSDDAESPPVAVVSETFARTLFPGRSAVGRRARTLFGPPEAREIVGVVSDVKHRGPQAETPPVFYAPQKQMRARGFSLVVRADAPPRSVIAQVRSAVWALDPELPVAEVATLEELLSRTVAEPRFYASLVSGFGILALLLAAVGLAGTLRERVGRRRREIGIRMALGARGPDVTRPLVRQGLALAGVGLALGLAAALLLSRGLAGLLFRLEPTDPLTYAGVVALMLVTAGLASWLPARRAARVDPAEVIRE